MVKNNSGEVTASVNEDGLLEVGAGLFSGLIRKKKTIITPDKLEGYTEENSINGYIRLNFVKTGSFVELSGDIGKKTGGNYPTIILPFHNPNASNASLGVTSEEAATCLGQTFIVRNNTSPAITINIIGYTSLVGGSDANHPYWLESDMCVILEVFHAARLPKLSFVRFLQLPSIPVVKSFPPSFNFSALSVLKLSSPFIFFIPQFRNMLSKFFTFEKSVPVRSIS